MNNTAVGRTVRITNNLDGRFTGFTSLTTTFTAIHLHPSFKNFEFVIPLGLSPDHYDVAVRANRGPRMVLSLTAP